MERSEFAELLHNKGYQYDVEDNNKIVIYGAGPNNPGVYLEDLDVLPSNIEFRNESEVNLENLDILGNNVIFSNKGSVFLNELKKLPGSTKFNNRTYVRLDSLRSIPSSVEFNNGGNIHTKYIDTMRWGCNIKGIKSSKVFNLFVSKGWL